MMKKICVFSVILFLSVICSNCSSDDANDPATLFVNGAEFKLGTNSGNHQYNLIKSENTGNIWLSISEKNSPSKAISIYAAHEEGSHSGTYILKNDQIASGIAVLAIMDDSGHQVAGGALNSPSGTVTISDYGHRKFKITFNDVVLDPETGTETTITGYCVKTFSPE
jgi:uncharacterized protein YcfL